MLVFGFGRVSTTSLRRTFATAGDDSATTAFRPFDRLVVTESCVKGVVLLESAGVVDKLLNIDVELKTPAGAELEGATGVRFPAVEAF